MTKLSFAAEVGELFAKAARAGLTHDQLISVLQSQLELEQKFKKDDERKREVPITLSTLPSQDRLAMNF